MKADAINPFLVSGYQGPKFFCDREDEVAALVSAFSNRRNVTLISPRRMGKTGLVHHAFNRLAADDNDCRCFYLDIFATQNLAEFTSLFGKVVLGKLDGFSEAAMRKLSGFFKSFKPRFTIDPQNGSPEMTLDIRQDDSDLGLSEIFAYIKQSNRQCCIAIDEFQQILSYPEKGVEALLRSHTQFLPNAAFVFAGSEKHLMDEMFASAKRPFYQSAQKISLGPIHLEAYQKFASAKFSAAGRSLPAEVFARIYGMLSGHTWYIQLVLNLLYSESARVVGDDDVDRVVAGILAEENATYKTYCDMLTPGQFRVLRAVAAENNAASPTGSAFLKRHDLGAASSVRLALKALQDKSLILRNDEGRYSVYDRFFGIWLAR
ncbi:MAG: ATP-binding protein [FCB group bacterium]|nr:ATP-binding protein [FCB group bacterium]